MPTLIARLSLISTSVRMVHLRRTSDEKRPGRGRQRINPREFATTGPRTPETAANFLLHRGLRQDGVGDQRGVSQFPVSHFVRKNRGVQKTLFANSCTVFLLADWSSASEITGVSDCVTKLTLLNTSGNCW